MFEPACMNKGWITKLVEQYSLNGQIKERRGASSWLRRESSPGRSHNWQPGCRTGPREAPASCHSYRSWWSAPCCCGWGRVGCGPGLASLLWKSMSGFISLCFPKSVNTDNCLRLMKMSLLMKHSVQLVIVSQTPCILWSMIFKPEFFCDFWNIFKGFKGKLILEYKNNESSNTLHRYLIKTWRLYLEF